MFIIKTLGAFFMAYGITSFICYLIDKHQKNYGGDGSLRCPTCNQQLTLKQTLKLSNCPFCNKYF